MRGFLLICTDQVIPLFFSASVPTHLTSFQNSSTNHRAGNRTLPGATPYMNRCIFFPLLTLFAISVHPSSFQKQLLDQLSTIQYESLTTALLVHRMQVVALWWTMWQLHLVIRLTRKTQRNKAMRFKMLMLTFLFWLVFDPELISHLSWKELKWTSACDMQEVKLLLENHP